MPLHSLHSVIEFCILSELPRWNQESQLHKIPPFPFLPFLLFFSLFFLSIPFVPFPFSSLLFPLLLFRFPCFPLRLFLSLPFPLPFLSTKSSQMVWRSAVSSPAGSGAEPRAPGRYLHSMYFKLECRCW